MAMTDKDKHKNKTKGSRVHENNREMVATMKAMIVNDLMTMQVTLIVTKLNKYNEHDNKNKMVMTVIVIVTVTNDEWQVQQEWQQQ